MTVKFLREVLKHYEGKEYDDWEIKLFDFNNQRNLKVNDGTYAASKDTKSITFTVNVEPVDGETIDQRVKRLLSVIEKQTKEWSSRKKQENK